MKLLFRSPLLLAGIILFLWSCNQQSDSNLVSDPLPSWNEGPAKQSIVDFVEATTTQGSTSFIPEDERITVFDNDGTLWSEKPYYFQLQFAMDRIKTMAPDHPEWKDKQPFKAVLEKDTQKLLESGTEGILKLVMVSHSGMTADDFESIVKVWIDTAHHTGTGRLFKEMVYQPMLEVLGFFRANGFKTWIVSGGGIEFIRPWAEEVYGIPPEQVIGSSIKLRFEMADGKPVIVRLPELDFIDDKEGKPVGIENFIGRKPVAAFGNSDGDLQMLQYTAGGDGRKLLAFIHHTDTEREWSYDRESHVGKLDKGLDVALEKGWILVDMKNDWSIIFPD